jgi:hypothetical protein
VIVVAHAWKSHKDTVSAETKWTGREPGWAYRGREQVEDARLFRLWVDDFAGGSAVMVLSKSGCPEIEAKGKTLVVAGQTYVWDGVKLRIGSGSSSPGHLN